MNDAIVATFVLVVLLVIARYGGYWQEIKNSVTIKALFALYVGLIIFKFFYHLFGQLICD